MFAVIFEGTDGRFYGSKGNTEPEVVAQVAIHSGTIRFKVQGSNPDKLARELMNWMEENGVEEIIALHSPIIH